MPDNGFPSEIKNQITLRKATLVSLLGVILLLVILPVYGDQKYSGPQQTWPTRTPTPPAPTSEPPPKPTQEPPKASATPIPPSNTNTPSMAQTPTQPVPATLTPASSPISSVVAVTETSQPEGVIPTSPPCGSSPTVFVRFAVTIRTGPRIDYQPITTLSFSDVRLIIGRAQYAPWWLIQLGAGERGWVADQAVSVQGNIGAVPVLSTPVTGEELPTPFDEWKPTPNPICEPTIIGSVDPVGATPSLTPLMMTPQSVSDQAAESEDKISQTPDNSKDNTASDQAADVKDQAPEIFDEGPIESRRDVSLPPAPSGPGGAHNWLLVVGLAFLLVGAGIYILQRSRD